MSDLELFEKFKKSRFFSYYYDLVEWVRKFERTGVDFIFVQTPLAQNIRNLSSFEKERLECWTFDFNNISVEDVKMIKEVYSPDIDVNYLKSLYEGTRVVVREGIRLLLDYKSDYVNITDGKRNTCYQPKRYSNKIYLFGQCTLRGTGVEDKETIASFLQEKVNESFPDRYLVENMAIGCGSDLHDDLYRMKQLNYCKGDIVVLCTNLEIVPAYIFTQDKIMVYDSSVLFEHPHTIGEWFTDMTFHTNAKGNMVIANYIYRVLNNNKMLIQEDKYSNEIVIKSELNIDLGELEDGLKEYLQYIRNFRSPYENVGAIVMNCNPFTKGHRYLIETAANQVDCLYIFVVEEDKSFFPFKDRLMLVKKGTEDINNVVVLNSGKYIISLATFPGYFNKDNDKNAVIDASMDIRIFSQYIAKELGIKTRFVGEEPTDMVTNQYNRQMDIILKEYGIEFIEIERKKSENQVISASKVRAYLEDNNFEEIRKIVPDTTYEYLLQRFRK